ncbi:MAG: Transketolase central region [Berkelbacteria bacterium GW2011_GWA2_35_9]|uniref:Transketolase central region n=1 Tax=Berkelbacteria bacterium GW2011_GWA2_35_9 TaxID=1618333 RepID=A0A0G0D452_9BACT|nr:MAG: Transketolase central region [Berkelbacteria bacterium GW2011_GWA2_35_9]
MALCRQGFGEGLKEAAEKNKKIVGLCCDLTGSTKMDIFKSAFPDRFVEIGVAEQNMIGVASGLAMEGKIPFCASYAVFTPGRSWDQIRVSVAYQNLNVKIIGAHAGLSVGPDGATHQALEDIASLRAIPNLTIIAPCDYYETKKATLEMAEYPGPIYLRIPREETPIITAENDIFEIGKANIIYQSKIENQIVIIGAGPILYEALEAGKALEKSHKIGVTIVNSHTIKPLDEKTVLEQIEGKKLVVVCEEHQKTGGLFSAVSELLSQRKPTKVLPIGVDNLFGESGKPEELMVKYGLSKTFIYKKITKAIQN